MITLFVRKQKVKSQESSYLPRFLTVVKNWKFLKGGGYIMNCESSSCSAICVPAEARRFFTKEEKIAMLAEYKKALEKETQGVAERISELAKEE